MKKGIILIILVSLANVIFAQSNVIEKNNDNTAWSIYTNSSLYQISVTDAGSINMTYFGNRVQDVKHLKNQWKDELPVRGGYSNTTPMLEVIFADGVRDIELTFVDANITTIDGYSTLIIKQKDVFYPLMVTEYIRVLPEYDLIEKWTEVKNTGKRKNEIIKIENAQSGSFFLPKDNYYLTHLSGTWGHEFQPNETRLTQGLKTLQVKDFRSFGSSFFAIRPEGEKSENNGKVWYGSLIYSGNWRVDFEKSAYGEVQVVSGINFWDQDINLKAGEIFTTPKMLAGYTEKGMEGVSQNLASYTREQILPKKHRNELRPVLYNSWYATAFNVNEEHQLALAKIAKEIGVEMFVIDDGWFKGRVNDHAGLGDWTVDKNKFPNGLKPMIDKINDMGLDFGIWIEPEMVNPNSDLYRAHPDWVYHYPNRTRHTGRNQLMLNLAREDVYEYLYNSFHKLLKENNIKFIKWDMNKSLTDPGFPSANTDEQRSVRIKYVKNLYRLIESLRQEFPDVWFENCASGGGRIDLGMLSRMDFNWASDNTDPVDRIFIQHSYLNAFPANTMISWVTREDWHRQNHPLDFKFNVSMCGVLGIGYDITKWTEEEKAIAKEKIFSYKEIRETVQFGDHYRLISPYENNSSVLQYVNKDKSESIVFVYNLAEYPNNAISETKRSKEIQLRGLQADALYKIEGLETPFTGQLLMDKGIVFPVAGAFKSKIFKLTKQ
ncbi:alpha-galactosidase [Tangfeifania diversioriginum]|uniref:Alpha-galactosidase n=1 Tax=Tangfeifania diversioriginum TaxID=1168035 RepID=A0A1M6H361_9BACT|nr:alpha-galactosidase [Tangfeifania diversioriginum]SHJ16572.1 alpha-galactosidase [Tangfeifania diversioriginum]